MKAALQKTFSTGLGVWPGDTNNDGHVSARDIVPIGRYWHKTGEKRSDATSEWKICPMIPWQSEKMATYADANGDGVVDEQDILSIVLFWKQSCPQNKSAAPRLEAAQVPAPDMEMMNAYQAMYDVLQTLPSETEGVRVLKLALEKMMVEIRQSLLPGQRLRAPNGRNDCHVRNHHAHHGLPHFGGPLPPQSLPARGTLLAARPAIGGCTHSPHAGGPAANKRASRQGLCLAAHAIGACHFHRLTPAAQTASSRAPQVLRCAAPRSGSHRQVWGTRQPPQRGAGRFAAASPRRGLRISPLVLAMAASAVTRSEGGGGRHGAFWSAPVVTAPQGPSRPSEVSGGSEVLRHSAEPNGLRMTCCGAFMGVERCLDGGPDRSSVWHRRSCSSWSQGAVAWLAKSSGSRAPIATTTSAR